MNVLYLYPLTCFENYTILSTERFAFLGRLELYCRKEHLGDGKLWGLCIVPWKGKIILAKSRTGGEK